MGLVQRGQFALESGASRRTGVAILPRLLQLGGERGVLAPLVAIDPALLEFAQPRLDRGQGRRALFGRLQPLREVPGLPRLAFRPPPVPGLLLGQAPRRAGEAFGHPRVARFRGLQPARHGPVGGSHPVRQHVYVAIGERSQVLGRQRMGDQRPERSGDVGPGDRARPERFQIRLVPRRPAGFDRGAVGLVQVLLKQARQPSGLAQMLHEPAMHLVVGGVPLGNDTGLAADLDQLAQAETGAENAAIHARRDLPQLEAVPRIRRGVRGATERFAHRPSLSRGAIEPVRAPGRAHALPPPADPPNRSGRLVFCAPRPPPRATRPSGSGRCCARSTPSLSAMGPATGPKSVPVPAGIRARHRGTVPGGSARTGRDRHACHSAFYHLPSSPPVRFSATPFSGSRRAS